MGDLDGWYEHEGCHLIMEGKYLPPGRTPWAISDGYRIGLERLTRYNYVTAFVVWGIPNEERIDYYQRIHEGVVGPIIPCCTDDVIAAASQWKLQAELTPLPEPVKWA